LFATAGVSIMENFITILLIIVSGIFASILANPFPHGFDDEGGNLLRLDTLFFQNFKQVI